MAGMGKRMRPHTLTIPKPLVKVAGKPIVEHLVLELASIVKEQITDIGFIIGNFGTETEQNLLQIAESVGAKGHIFYQHEALGTAHAVYCAEPLLQGPVIVAFADTLFKAHFEIDDAADAVIWVSKVDNPQSFGVVQLNDDNQIIEFVEKPQQFVSDLAIIGIYYFKQAQLLKNDLKQLIDNNRMVNGEYQLTDSLENLKNQSLVFKPGTVDEWLDCGNKNATVYTNQRVLHHIPPHQRMSDDAQIINSVVIQPCFIAEGVVIENAVIGPYASIGKHSKISHSIIKNSIIQENASIFNANIENSMVGNFTYIHQKAHDYSLADYCQLL